MTAGALAALGALGALALLGRSTSGRPAQGARRRRDPGSSSGARWARRHDLRPLAVRGPGAGRLVVGRAAGVLVAVEHRHSLLVVGPTQSGKTSGLAIPAILEWEGPVVAASVKADLARHSVGWRRRTGHVWLFDPTRATALERHAWSPLDAVHDWPSARRMAQALTEAARPAAGAMADADFWYATAAKLLAPVLLAAAGSGRTMADVVAWIDEQEELEVAECLAAMEQDVALRAARATWARDERQRSAVYTTAETVIDVFADETVLGPERGPRIDPDSLLRGPNTLHLCAPSHDQRRLRPLFTALVTEVLDRAVRAAEATGGSLDPPLLVVLDEAAHVAPLAELDTLAATAAGHGIQLVTVWQDLSQITARYGGRANSVVNNHRAKLFLSGIGDPATLEHASVLAGETDAPQRTRTVGGPGAGSTAETTVARRLLPADALRRTPPGTGVLVSGHLPPARVVLRPWWCQPVLRRRATLGPADTAPFDTAPFDTAPLEAQPDSWSGTRWGRSLRPWARATRSGSPRWWPSATPR